MTPQPPPRSVDEVVALLQAIDDGLPDLDGLKWFNRLYLRVTEAVRDRIAAGAFANPVWIAKLDVCFAHCYFEALERWQAGGPAPGCWRALFRQRGNTAISRIQFAMAGVNAHINHDLPMAIVEAMAECGADPQHGSALYSDYTDLNSTLSGLLEEVKRDWMVRLPGDALPAVSHVGEAIAAWSVAAAREAAWTNAELLWDVRDIPLIAGRYLHVIDGLTTVAGKVLLVPVPAEAPPHA